MPVITSNVNISDVHKVLERAAQHILDARGADPAVSRADIKQKLATLSGDERALVDMFFRFNDHRDAKPGARITKSDVDRTLDFAKRMLVERLDADGDKQLTNAEIARMSRIGKLAVAIAQAGASGGAAPVTPPAGGDVPAELKAAVDAGLVTLERDAGGRLIGGRVTSDFDENELTPNLVKLVNAVGANNLEKLHIGHISAYDSSDSYGAALDKLAELGPFEKLKSLFVADVDQSEAEISWIEVGGIAKAFAIAPNLESLAVRGGGVSLGSVEHEQLKSLKLESGGLPGEVASSIGNSRLPKLESLEIWFGAEEYGASGSARDIEGILRGDTLPGLKKLALKNAEFQGDIARAVVDAPILPRLEVLDLSWGTMVDADAQVLLDHKDRLLHLKVLNVEDNILSPDMVTKLKDAFGARLVTDEQGKYADWQSDPDYKYVSVGE